MEKIIEVSALIDADELEYIEPKKTTHICRRCGRKLRSEEAKQRGMGPVCYQKWMSENTHKKLFEVSSLHSSKDSV